MSFFEIQKSLQIGRHQLTRWAMDRRKNLSLLLSLAFGIVGWAAGQIVSPLWWLPYVALPLASAFMLLIGAQIWIDHRKASRRQSLNGFGVHLIIRVADIQHRRRQFIFDLGPPSKAGAAFYLSASRRFVFTVRDAQGESYSLELPAGWLGFPIADCAYFVLEAGSNGITTVMRAMVNGRILQERLLPFAVDFSGLGMNEMVLGANRSKTENGGFSLSELLFLNKTLDDTDARNMARYVSKKWNIPVE